MLSEQWALVSFSILLVSVIHLEQSTVLPHKFVKTSWYQRAPKQKPDLPIKTQYKDRKSPTDIIETSIDIDHINS